MNKPASQTTTSEVIVPAIGQPTLEEANTREVVVSTGEVKEFAFDSYYAPAEKRAYFGTTEITVKKGDTVRFKVTNTLGMHDIVIDEFDVSAETPLNETTVVEFVADKAGEFIYYCSKPGHRESGQWGKLKVLES